MQTTRPRRAAARCRYRFVFVCEQGTLSDADAGEAATEQVNCSERFEWLACAFWSDLSVQSTFAPYISPSGSAMSSRRTPSGSRK
jgi:hypothetical protein